LIHRKLDVLDLAFDEAVDQDVRSHLHTSAWDDVPCAYVILSAKPLTFTMVRAL
jgi:hypothetical protein